MIEKDFKILAGTFSFPNKEDFLDTKGIPRQILSPEREAETLDLAVERGQGFLIELSRNNALCGMKIGKNKTPSSIENKLSRKNLGLDTSYITDKGRMTGYVHSLDQLEEIDRLMLDRDFLESCGVVSVQCKDRTKQPKHDTGYRDQNRRFAVYVGDDHNKQPEFNIIEVQIVLDQQEHFYNTTHDHMKAAQQILAIPHQDRTHMQKTLASGHLAFCRFCNGLVGREFGYDERLSDRAKSRFTLTRNKQDRLEVQLMKMDQLIRDLGETYHDGQFLGRPLAIRAEKRLEKILNANGLSTSPTPPDHDSLS